MVDAINHRRVILDLYDGPANRRVIAAAAEFARLLKLDLLGVLVEDAAVQGLAAFPFAREFRLPAHEWTPLDPERIAVEFQHVAMTARRLLAETAAPLGVTSVFETHCGDPCTVVPGLSHATDIIVVAEPRSHDANLTPSFARSWRAALSSEASVLLLPPDRPRKQGPVVALADAMVDGPNPARAKRSLLTAARIALTAGEDMLLLLPSDADAPSRDAAVAIVRAAGLPAERIRARSLSEMSERAILHALPGQGERLFVLARGGLAAEHESLLIQIAGSRSVPVLLVGQPPD